MSSADSLALPPVPPPAPATHPWRDAAVAAGFCAALALGGLGALRAPAALEFEFRALAPWPAPKMLRTFPAEFERAFADRFGGRSALLRLHHRAMVDLFGVSPAPNVLIGRDGWLYFLGEDGRSLERHYRGTLPIGDAEIAAVVAELKRRQEFLASLGIPYVVTIIPEKFTIYPEHLPDWTGAPKAPTPLERLIAALNADGSVRIVDLRAPLRDAKGRNRLYYATDSHWNMLGAAVGYAAIMREVQRALPPGKLAAVAPAAMPPYVPGVDFYAGDLARQVGYPTRYREADYAPFAKVLGDPGTRCARRTDRGADEGFEFYACARPELPRAVVYRDSMAIPLIPLLSENFSRVVYVSSYGLDPALIQREKPDIVIEEMVERSMFSPAALPMP
jgi:alginate O-acetyltransferase complex protein AlgJ